MAANEIKMLDLRAICVSFFEKPVRNVHSHVQMTIGEVYGYITGPAAKQSTSALRELTDRKQAQQYKASHFDYVTFGGVFSERKADKLLSYSQLLCLDFDHLPNLQHVRQLLLGDAYFETLLLFTSPSGDGLKWVVRVDLQRAVYADWFRALSNYLRATYGFEVDESGKDVCRACFLPHDPSAYINPLLLPSADDPCHSQKSLEGFDVQAWATCSTSKPKDAVQGVSPTKFHAVAYEDNTVEQIGLLVDELVSRGIDVTAGYSNWVNVAFALADAMGEEGRAYFHELSRMNAEYDPVECDRKYTSCLRGSGSGIHAATLFQMGKEAGVDVAEMARRCTRAAAARRDFEGIDVDAVIPFSATSASVPLGTKNEKEGILGVLPSVVTGGSVAELAETPDAEDQRSHVLPTFSDKLPHEDWPAVLLPVLEGHGDAVGRDKMMLGSLNILSYLLSVHETVYGVYDRRKVYPNIYNVIFGSYATMKGELEGCKHLLDGIKRQMKEQYETELAAYELAKTEWDTKNKKERGPEPKEPEYKSPIISANSSASAVYRQLNANKGSGAIFETEADTLSNMFSKSEYGDYSDLLRKAHHHETASMVRVSEHLRIEVERPRMSALLTCTGSQIPLFLPSAHVANGLASRFLFYQLPESSVEFHDVFAGTDNPIEELYQGLGNRLMPLYEELKQRSGHPVQFVLNKTQQGRFLHAFRGLLHEQYAMLGDGIQGFIFRLGLECFRYAMILSVLRRFTEWEEMRLDHLFTPDEQALTCDDRDISIALAIVECLVCHTDRVFSVIGGSKDDPFSHTSEKPREDHRRLLAALPAGREFATAEMLSISRGLGIAQRTAYRLMSDLTNKFGVVDCIRQGLYFKR